MGLAQAYNFIENKTLAQLFSRGLSVIFKNNFFYRTLPIVSSVSAAIYLCLKDRMFLFIIFLKKNIDAIISLNIWFYSYDGGNSF